jgi:hypothetical protein
MTSPYPPIRERDIFNVANLYADFDTSTTDHLQPRIPTATASPSTLRAHSYLKWMLETKGADFAQGGIAGAAAGVQELDRAFEDDGVEFYEDQRLQLREVGRAFSDDSSFDHGIRMKGGEVLDLSFDTSGCIKVGRSYQDPLDFVFV